MVSWKIHRISAVANSNWRTTLSKWVGENSSDSAYAVLRHFSEGFVLISFNFLAFFGQNGIVGRVIIIWRWRTWRWWRRRSCKLTLNPLSSSTWPGQDMEALHTDRQENQVQEMFHKICDLNWNWEHVEAPRGRSSDKAAKIRYNGFILSIFKMKYY